MWFVGKHSELVLVTGVWVSLPKDMGMRELTPKIRKAAHRVRSTGELPLPHTSCSTQRVSPALYMDSTTELTLVVGPHHTSAPRWHRCEHPLLLWQLGELGKRVGETALPLHWLSCSKEQALHFTRTTQWS